jgi:hypothetical protein
MDVKADKKDAEDANNVYLTYSGSGTKASFEPYVQCDQTHRP